MRLLYPVKILWGLLMLALLCSYAGYVDAACVPDPTCPANTVCIYWGAPTTKQDGTPEPASDLGAYTLYLDNTKVIGTALATATSFNYPIPAGICIDTGHPWAVQASSVTAGTNAQAISPAGFLCATKCGPPLPKPSAPTGLRAQ